MPLCLDEKTGYSIVPKTSSRKGILFFFVSILRCQSGGFVYFCWWDNAFYCISGAKIQSFPEIKSIDDAFFVPFVLCFFLMGNYRTFVAQYVVCCYL